MTTFKRPVLWDAKKDNIILRLFDIVSTEKLSVLMQISTTAIVQRKQYLDKYKKMESLELELSEQIKQRLINCEKKQMLRHIQQAINLAENYSYSLVDKEYFAEMDDPLSVMDMLICAALCIESELKEE